MYVIYVKRQVIGYKSVQKTSQSEFPVLNTLVNYAEKRGIILLIVKSRKILAKEMVRVFLNQMNVIDLSIDLSFTDENFIRS